MSPARRAPNAPKEGPVKRVIVTGSVAYDYIMSFPGDFRDHILPDRLDVLSVSFLVDSLRREPGGCATNIAYTLALFGERPTVLASVGHDFSERARLEMDGVDMSGVRVFDEDFTASFFVSTDQRNCQVANFYIGAMARAVELSLDDVDTTDAVVVISPNAPEAMVKTARECKERGVPYIYDPSQQIVRLSGEELYEGIDGCHVLVLNEYELALVQEKTGLGIEDLRPLCEILVVTQGEEGSRIYENGVEHEIPIVPAQQELDPTGVGDAYRSGILLGLTRDLPWPIAGRVGALAATYALESLGTQRHVFTPAELLARYEESFGAAPDELRGYLSATAPA